MDKLSIRLQALVLPLMVGFCIAFNIEVAISMDFFFVSLYHS
jgi:hypothetical protein